MDSSKDRRDSPAPSYTETPGRDPVLEDNRTFKQRCLANTKENVLLVLLLLGLGAGVGMGIGLRAIQPPFDDRTKMYIRFPGDLLMRMLKMLIIPLVVSSLISGLANLDAKSSGKMGLRAIVYYLSTTFIAVILGIILVLTIKPGERTEIKDDGERTQSANVADSFLDLIRNMLPDNLIKACFKQTKTTQIERTRIEHVNLSALNDSTTSSPNSTDNGTRVIRTYDFDVREEDGMNVLGLVVYSVAMGIVTSRLGEVGRPILAFTTALAEATMTLVTLVIWYSPIGIAFLVASEILKMEDPIRDLEALGMYMVTVIAGLAIHGIIILPLLYLVFVRKNPLTYLAGALQAYMTAFGTASSSATLPVTYKCLEQKNKVDKRVTRFVLPVGATVNMDGTALYEAVAAIFIAQMRRIPLSFGQIVAASITATAASIGAAAVPQAGIVTMVIVLTALGLPTDDVSRILAVDWLLDRFRTAINVEGDSVGAAIVAHLSRRELAEPHHDMDMEDLSPEDKPIDAYSSNPMMEKGVANGGFIHDHGRLEEKTHL